MSRPHDASDDKSRVTLVYDQVLPNVPGKSIRGVLVEYEPGGLSPAHTHPNSAFIYATVLEGAIRSQVNDGPVTTYRAGESFSEFPGDRHGVSENASTTEPARLLAMFVVDTRNNPDDTLQEMNADYSFATLGPLAARAESRCSAIRGMPAYRKVRASPAKPARWHICIRASTR
jgi:quercetin dioxygenase-like cupin family protein